MHTARPPIVRKVDIDFDSAVTHWCPGQPEYSQLLNAISTLIPYLEPFLIRTVREAASGLPEQGFEDLQRDVRLFVGQEGRHFRLHAKCNRRLREDGYEWLVEPEARIKADFDRFRTTKGNRFCLAYSEGFETFGPHVASFFFDKGVDLMGDDLDEPTVYLWLWHFAEEYEHRTVCNYLYKARYDDYRLRIYALWYATVHLFGYSFRVAHRLIRADRRSGRIPDPWGSRWRFAKVVSRFAAHLLPQLVGRCMRPSYDPVDFPAPSGALEFLAQASERYGVAGTA